MDKLINGLDLFSGIGGISLGLREWVRPIAYCEIDPYCRAVLLSRMSTNEISEAPIWDDIKSFNVDCRSANIDIIYGGFPCQDISIAGNGKGLAGERSGLFFEIMRLAKEIKPKFLFLENVPAITSRGGFRVVREIAALGYDCRWCVISAEEVGAKHKRERWFLLAHAQGERSQEGRQPLRTETQQPIVNDEIKYGIWDKEPESKFELDGVVNGVSNRLDRIKALGNAVVPIQVNTAFKLLMGIK